MHCAHDTREHEGHEEQYYDEREHRTDDRAEAPVPLAVFDHSVSFCAPYFHHRPDLRFLSRCHQIRELRTGRAVLYIRCTAIGRGLRLNQRAHVAIGTRHRSDSVETWWRTCEHTK